MHLNMDDFNIANLRESKNEWCCYLVDIMTPLIRDGVRSMFKQAVSMCMDKGEPAKYLMTFQNLLSLVSKWNSLTIEEERKRIVEQSGCSYLEELIVCVHIIHLKVMTHIRVGNKQKKIDISLPKLDDFIHKVYIHVARHIYKNTYLFETGLDPLTQQKYNREVELIIQQSILSSVRDSIPKEQIIRSFMDESVEHEEEVIIEPLAAVAPPPPPEEAAAAAEGGMDPVFDSIDAPETGPEAAEPEVPKVPSVQNVDNDKNAISRITFNEFDHVLDMGTNREEKVLAPRKTMQEKLAEAVPLENFDLDVEDIGGGSAPAPSAAEDMLGLLGVEEI